MSGSGSLLIRYGQGKMTSCKLVKDGEIDRNRWQFLFEESSYATPFQGLDWYDFHHSLNDPTQIPFVVGVEDENKQLMALVTGILLQETGWKRALTRRAIINGGVLLKDGCSVSPELLEILITGINLYLKHKGVIYGEIRNLNDYSLIKKSLSLLGWEYQPHLNFHVDSSDCESMRQRISSGRKRDIKYGEKRGVLTRRVNSKEEIETWYEILKNLYREKVKTPLPPLSYFKQLLSYPISNLIVVTYDGTVIGGLLGVHTSKKVFCNMFCCGLDEQYKSERIYPSILATWGAMDLAHKEGIPRFDFMGAGKPGVPYGVRDFKAKFGGELVEHGRFIKLFAPIRYSLGKMAVTLMKKMKK